MAGRPVALTAVEFRLLAAILGAGGRVLTRDQLLDAVYGRGEVEVLDRTIDAHVRRLREKLEDDPDRPALRGDGAGRRVPRRAETHPSREPAVSRRGRAAHRGRRDSGCRRRPADPGDRRDRRRIAILRLPDGAARLQHRLERCDVPGLGGAGRARRRARGGRRGGRARHPRRRPPGPAAPGDRGGRAQDRGGALRVAHRPARARGDREPGGLVQPDGSVARGAGAHAPRVHRERGPRAADAAHESQGVPRGAARRSGPARPGDLRIACGRRPSDSSASPTGSTRSPQATQPGPRPSWSWISPRRSALPWSLSRPRPARQASRSPSRSRPDCPLAATRTSSRRSSETCSRTPCATRRPAEGSTSGAERRPADILVSVTNTGEGIPADGPAPRLRALLPGREVARPARGGAGIGLSIVKQLVEGHGGRVGAESADGGNRVWFSLPA